METEDLAEKRAKLKSWLALHRMSRKEFAEKIGMHVTSINGWFSNVNIPDKKWQDIKKLFEPSESEPSQARHRVVGSTFTDEEADRIRRAAGDRSIEEYLRETLLRQADIDLGEK